MSAGVLRSWIFFCTAPGAAAIACFAAAWPAVPLLPRDNGPASLDFRAGPSRQEPEPSLRRATLPGPFPAAPLRVVDGDTFEARLRVWFGQDVVTLVRLRNIDAPELKARCRPEAKLAGEARATLEAILRSGEVVLTDLSLDKYAGRIVAAARVIAQDHADDVGELMLAGGYARPYGGGRRRDWCG